MKYQYLIIAFMLFIALESCNKKISIVPVQGVTIDSPKIFDAARSTRIEFFLVKNYRDDGNSAQYIDDYVLKNSNNRKRYLQYHMLFMKESEKTNLQTIRESLKPNGKSQQNEDDLIYEYGWGDHGKVFKKEKSDVKKLESDPNIKIENIPVKDDSTKNGIH